MRAELGALMRAGQHSLILERAREKASSTGGLGDNAIWVSVYACQAAGAMGKWGEAIVWAERGLAQQPDAEAAGWLYFLLGTAHIWAGDPHSALQYLDRFLAQPPVTPGLERLVPDAYFNRGFAFYFVKNTTAQIQAFQRAAELYAHAGRFSRSLVCQAELAWSHLIEGDVKRALPHLELIDQELADHGDPDLEVTYAICRALFHYLEQKNEAAQPICLEFLDRPDLTPGQRADFLWILGLVAHRSGDLAEALTLAESAYQHARKELWPPQLRRLERFMASMTEQNQGQ
ncbi:MAG: tetratricopeptide repeat protein [Bacillota bacterium]